MKLPTTNEGGHNMEPFILRFAHQIPSDAGGARTLRYDARRQITQILENGGWVDAHASRTNENGSTRTTKVRPETTDDE
jgi:hypothetical protein